MKKLSAARKLGLGWAVWRTGYELRKKTGLLKRRLPTPEWDQIRLADILSPGIPVDPVKYREYRSKNAPSFFFDKLPSSAILQSLLTPEQQQKTISIADDFSRGRFLYYSKHLFDLGFPPDWLRNPFTNARYENDRHWCELNSFDADKGDIKDVWEPSRFAAAYWLVRAYALTSDEKYPTAFWTLFESWCDQNPPNRGPNWRCGQETSFRLMAWCFALHGFCNSPATSPQRVASMVCALHFSASRIEPNIDYAVSQKNNHAISEALGLFTVGTLFPELRQASHWAAEGRRILEREILRQVYEDGSYVQQSMNYHRVLLHDCLWTACLAELSGKPLSRSVLDRISKAAEFLFEMLDQPSGRVPNYGANDGALVLPLSSGDYRDYRDTVQAANYLHTRKRILAPGPWDETLLWLFGEESLRSPIAAKQPRSSRFDAGGYYTIRALNSWAMIRCHTYRDRPGHVDMLHLDLWHDGKNVLQDSGSYRYFAPSEPGIEKQFKDIAAHNTIQIGDTGPLDLVSRFIWIPWPSSTCLHHDATRFEGEHDAYDRAPWHVRHRREVEALNNGRKWIIKDQLTGTGTRFVTLRWHLGSNADIHIEAPRGMSEKREESGQISEYYADRQPAMVVEVTGNIPLPATLITSIALS